MLGITAGAYVAGNPFSTTDIGMSDDGEPQGTAGKPMLSVLRHKKIGEIVVVVTRYFGGIKLGAGGLVRAYSSSVQQVLEKLKLQKIVLMKRAEIIIPYEYENSIRMIFKKIGVNILDIQYKETISMKIESPEGISNDLNPQIKNITAGKCEILWD